MLSSPDGHTGIKQLLVFKLYWDFPAEETLVFVIPKFPLHHQFYLEKEKKELGKMNLGSHLNPELV